MWFMYVVECRDQTFYTGITTDLQRRIKQHNSGRGAAYTAMRRPVRFIAAWVFPDRSQALKAESAFKKRSRQRKIAVIEARSSYFAGVFFENETLSPVDPTEASKYPG